MRCKAGPRAEWVWEGPGPGGAGSLSPAAARGSCQQVRQVWDRLPLSLSCQTTAPPHRGLFEFAVQERAC